MKRVCTKLMKVFTPLILTLFTLSCDVSTPLEESAKPVENDLELVLSKISSYGFNTEDYFIEDGKVVVEGDIAFDIESVKNDNSETNTRQYAHTHLVSQSKASYIRVKTVSGIPVRWSTALDSAISSWNGISACKIRFVRVSSSSSADITITRNSTSHDYIAYAQFPDNDGKPGRTININPIFINGNEPSKMRFVMAHELAHCLGMRHLNNSESNRIHIPGTPVYDNNSVMRPEVDVWTGFSTGDINMARYLYPQSGKYIIVYEHTGYKGRSWVIHEGQNQAFVTSFGMNDNISSIRCYGGARVTVYEHSNYEGGAMTIN